MKRKAVYPGSFDPITLAHLDVIRRAARVVDELVIAVLDNESKSPLFTREERELMVSEALAVERKNLPNVSVCSFSGLLADLMQKTEATVAIRGLRFVSDFEYELQMAQMNAAVGDVETFFMATSPRYAFLSSGLVKEIASHGRDVSAFVSSGVNERLREKFAQRSNN